MILATLVLGGTILGATTIAGFLMLYQIRQSTEFASSGKAIFAADAGLECALFQFLRPGEDTNRCNPSVLSNGASFDFKCYNGSNEVIDCNSEEVLRIRSIGKAAGATRAFELSF